MRKRKNARRPTPPKPKKRLVRRVTVIEAALPPPEASKLQAVANRWGQSIRTLQREIHDGHLRHVKFRGRVLILRSDEAQWVRTRLTASQRGGEQR